MKPLFLSAHSLDVAACPRRYFYYRLLNRAPAAVTPALAQGIAGHGALARWRRGRSQAEQDEFIDKVFAAHPVPADDYRSAAYLRDALVQYKAEYREPDRWTFEEVETTFQFSLGFVEDREVILTGRRDAVGMFEDGRRYILDNKFTSRDEQAAVKAATVSRAAKAYWWSWHSEHPDKPLAGVIQRRTIIRKPTKKDPLNFSFPADPVVRFDEEIIAEWARDTMRLARTISQRHEESIEDWPMEGALCRSTFGCCDYLDVCVLPPGDRHYLLQSDAFRPSDSRPDYDEKEEA